MSNDVLVEFQQQEAESTALAVQLNRWSLVLIELQIQEQEEKLLAGDLPVDVSGPAVTSEELTPSGESHRPADRRIWPEMTISGNSRREGERDRVRDRVRNRQRSVMRMLQRLLSDRRAAERWQAGLTWFRLRYLDAERTTRCLVLLSRPELCERLALCHAAGPEVTRLYVGLPAARVERALSLAGDCGFSLTEAVPAHVLPAAPLTPAAGALPWDREFVAHIVDGQAFVDAGVDTPVGRKRFLPDANGRAEGPATWTLPDQPPLGMTLQPEWPDQTPPADLIAGAEDPTGWPLGKTRDGLPLQAQGRVNIYGRAAAVAYWLTCQATQLLGMDPAGLVIIDGVGDLAPQLKRKEAVTRLLAGRQLTYLDLDGAGTAGGLNPLAGVPGESETGQVARWERWFQGLGAPAQGMPLLGIARQTGVSDIPALRKWLQQEERRRPDLGVTGLRMAVERLTIDPAMRQWLEWPTNPFDILPGGTLIFSCRASDWARRRLLHAVLLSALAAPDVRLIVHGFPWHALRMELAGDVERVIVSNGPLMTGASVLTTCDSKTADALAAGFLPGDVCLHEHLQLLGRGEGLVFSRQRACFVTWNGLRDPADGAPALLRL